MEIFIIICLLVFDFFRNIVITKNTEIPENKANPVKIAKKEIIINKILFINSFRIVNENAVKVTKNIGRAPCARFGAAIYDSKGTSEKYNKGITISAHIILPKSLLLISMANKQEIKIIITEI